MLFAHDHKLHNYNDEFYSNGSFSTEVMERYTAVFEEVTFISRQIKVDEKPTNMSLVNAEGIRFTQVPDFLSIKTLIKKNEAKKIIEKEIKTADYVIARIPSSIGSLAVKAAIKYKKPYLIEVVADPWDAHWNHSFKGKIIAPYTYFSTKKIIKSSKYTIYVTNTFLQRRYPTNGKSTNCSNVILDNIDENIIQKRINKVNNKKDNEKIIIGTTAAVDVKYKGQQYIIQALGELKKRGVTNYEYQLVGGGNQSYLKKIAEKYEVSEYVKFLGLKPHDKVFDWLDNIDLYTQPSRQEGLPRALIESMSRGLPAFGSRTAGIPELLDEHMIFSRSKNHIEEICSILLHFSREEMINQAIRNFSESKEYEKLIIEKRRNEFLKMFIKNSRKKE